MDISCPFCGKKRVVKKGKRKSKLIEKQLYLCKVCKKRFALNNLENKTYPAKVVVNAISCYNLGNSLRTVSRLMNSKFKVMTQRSTIHNWIKNYEEFCTYHKLREKSLRMYKPERLVFEKVFDHQQPYKYKYHKAKAKMFLNNFRGLRSYLLMMHSRCPNNLFLSDNARCSCIRLKPNVPVRQSFNNACRLTGLALKSVDDNMKRHERIQEFMLLNDSCTLAAEVPVWMSQEELLRYPFLKDVVSENSLTGHIDLVQVRFGKVYILDYKPDAEKEANAVSQLFVYALALSLRARIKLDDIVCGWFDEKYYFEFSPSESLASLMNVMNFDNSYKPHISDKKLA